MSATSPNAFACCAVLVLLAACGEAAPAAPPPVAAPPPAPAAAPSGPAPARPVLAGTISVKDGATPKGRLVLGWRSAEDQRELDAGRMTLAAIRRLVDTLTPGDDVDFGKTTTVSYRIADAPADATAVVFLDVDHSFWPTMFGHGPGFTGTGTAGGDVALMARPAHKPEAEPCGGPRRKLVTIDAPELTSSRPGPRRFCAWLPKDWSEKSKRRYPLVLLLPGFLSDEMAYLSDRGGMGAQLDEVMARSKRDAVVVGVDTSTALGSTYLEDSRGHGPWDTFLIKRALPVLERELHTIPRASARALAGHSTGGYNAISYAMRHPDVFSAIGSSSPDAPDVETWLFEPGTRRAKPWVRHWTMLDDALGGPGQVTSWAADWSPDASPRGFAWPFDVKTGLADEAIVARWVAKTPHGLLRDKAFVARVKKNLSGRIYLSVGKDDEFGLFETADGLAKELDALGIETRFVVTDTGHSGGQERLAKAFELILDRLDRATP